MMTETEIAAKLGLEYHPDDVRGEYSVALDMPAQLAAERKRNMEAAGSAYEPIRAHISLDHYHGLIRWYGTEAVSGKASYQIKAKGDYAALSYALAAIRRQNADWVANYKPFGKAEWDAGESKVIS